MGLGVLRDPAVVDEADGDGVEVVQLLAAVLARDHEAGLFEHAEVLHHAEAGHRREVDAQLTQALPVVLEQPVEEEASAGIPQRLEHLFHVGDYR